MKNTESTFMWAALGMLLVTLAILAADFLAPCGCYAGTAVKDVPLRCTEVGR